LGSPTFGISRLLSRPRVPNVGDLRDGSAMLTWSLGARRGAPRGPYGGGGGGASVSAGWPDPKRGRHPHPGHPGDSAAESSEEVPFGGWPRPTTRERGRGGKALVAAAVLVLLVVFVIRNSHQVRVDFIV